MNEFIGEAPWGDKILGPHRLNHRVAQALWEAAHDAEHYHGLDTGTTSLYWQLIEIVERHLKEEKK